MSQKSYDGSPAVYLVPTPIGNMEDITVRAIKILESVDVIFSEDTRVTSLLLQHFHIKKKLISNHLYNENDNKDLLCSYLEQGNNVAIVTDRGTPIISDPGYVLSKFAIDKGFHVIGLPGATAFVPALIMSGIVPSPFLFYGFLNSKDSKRKKELQELEKLNVTLIFYEAPHRIEKTLKNMLEILGNRTVSIAREISKKYEEIYRGNLDFVIRQIVDIKGEIVIVVSPNLKEKNYDNLTIIEHVHLFVKEGYSVMDSIKQVARERKIPKDQVYRTYHGLK